MFDVELLDIGDGQSGGGRPDDAEHMNIFKEIDTNSDGLLSPDEVSIGHTIFGHCFLFCVFWDWWI